MKKYILALCLGGMLSGCSDFLDIVPDNVAELDHAFRDEAGAYKYLATCYTMLPGGASGNPAISATDETWHYTTTGDSFKLLKQNADNPYLNYWSGTNLYKAIRNCNIFLENIGKVGPDLSGEMRERMIAEVKVLKAYYHFYLLRMYGPIILMKENLPVSASPEEVAQYREPFDDCVNYINQLLEEAINTQELPDAIVESTTELGRITRTAAYAIRADLLMTAASPLFNGNPDYTYVKDNRGVYLFSQVYDQSKWQRAADACKQAVECAENAGYSLYQFQPLVTEPVSDTTRIMESIRGAVTARPIENREILFATTHDPNGLTAEAMPYFTLGQVTNWPWLVGSCPTMHTAEMFYTNNGIPKEMDPFYDTDYYKTTKVTKEFNHRYYVGTDYVTANIHLNREPRFYANICFDGSIWYGQGRYQEKNPGGNDGESSWLMNLRFGSPSGKTQTVRYTATGYWLRKYANYKSTSTADEKKRAFIRYNFPIYRLADLYLMYTEAMNEASANQTYAEGDPIYTYIDKVRARAGLNGVVKSWKISTDPTYPLSKDGFRDVIKRERMIELCFEGKKYWDIRRWKDLLNINKETIRGWNIDGKTDIEFYQLRTLGRMQLSSRNYLWPIKIQDLKTNQNLVQNPGWE